MADYKIDDTVDITDVVMNDKIQQGVFLLLFIYFCAT